MVKASDNAYPSILITEGTEPSAPAAGKQRLYIDSTTHVLMIVNSSGTESAVASSAAMATDPLWDAAGDLAVGTGANTGAKLVKGAAGASLSIINAAVAWNSGTSMPGSAVTGDRYWRTDLFREYYYDGTRWLSTQLFAHPIHADSIAATAIVVSGHGFDSTGADIWLVNLVCTTAVATTNDGSKYWTVTLYDNDLAGTGGGNTALGNFNTTADTASQLKSHTITVGAMLDVSADAGFLAIAAKTSTPGALRLFGAVYYRIIGT